MKYLVLVLSVFFISPHAYAYLDPGTGSIIIQGLVALFAGMALFFSNLRFWIKDKLFGKKHDDNNNQESEHDKAQDDAKDINQ